MKSLAKATRGAQLGEKLKGVTMEVMTDVTLRLIMMRFEEQKQATNGAAVG